MSPARVNIDDLKPELRRKLFPSGAVTRSARAGKVRTGAPEGNAKTPVCKPEALDGGLAGKTYPRRSGPAQPSPDSVEHKPVWRCCPCGVEFTAYATVQTHIDTAHGGGRIAFVLDNKEGPND